MRNLITLLVLAASAGLALAGPTYRWVDTDGVHYSDQPHEGAEKITLGQTQTYTAAPAPADPGTPARRERAGGPAEFRYDSCRVVQPADDQVLIDVESATVAVEVRPAKRSGDHVVLSMDGAPLAAASPDQVEFRIAPIDRGTHQVAARVEDANGKSLCASPAVTFHVRQPSVFHPGKGH